MRVYIKVFLVLLMVSNCSTDRTAVTFFTWTPFDEYKVNQELIREFEEKYPGIKVKHMNDSSSQAMVKLQTMFAAGTPPDVMSIHGAYYIPLADKNALLNLEPLIEADKEFNLSDYYPVLVNICRYKKKLYSLPRYTSVYVMFYNKDLFRQEGISFPDSTWTWDDYLKAARALTKDINNDGVPEQYGCIIDFWGARLYPWIWANGGRLFNEQRTRCLVDQKPAIDAVQFLVDLQFKYKVTPRVLPQEYKSNPEMFSLGKVGMFMSGAWDIQNLKSVHVDWDIAPVPKKVRHATILGMENYAIARETRHPEKAWLLFKFLLSAHAQKYMAEKLEKQPTLASITDDYVKGNTGYNRHVLVNALKYAVKPPNIPQWNEVQRIWQGELDLIWIGQKSAAQGMTDAARKINKLLSADKNK